MSTARDALRQADLLRSQADEMKKFSDIAEPRVGLGVNCGTFRMSNNGNVRVLIDAARTEADRLYAEAESIEASVQVVES